MTRSISSNTQAILLLTAPLLTGRGKSDAEILSPGEYNGLARWLHGIKLQPSDLLDREAGEILGASDLELSRERLESLLGRGFLLGQALERWSARGIRVVSRADDDYPKRLKERLKELAPPVLYSCGDLSLLEQGGLAVVGSRNVDEELMEFTVEVGRLAASARLPIISGGAKGVDRASMHGALEAGGTVIGVMADSLERAVLARDNREPLAEGQLILLSACDPLSGFNVGNAMQRNKFIYALADAALVVTSDYNKGGTWAGATEQLKRFQFCPVFVRDDEKGGKGNAALQKLGAHPWPNPQDRDELRALMSNAPSRKRATGYVQETLDLLVEDDRNGGASKS